MTLQNNISTNSHISIKGDVIHAAPFLEDYISTNSYLEKRGMYKNEKPSLHNNLHTTTYLNNFYNKHKNEYIQEILNSYASVDIKIYDYTAKINNNIHTNSYCTAYIPYVVSYEYSAFYKLLGQPVRQYHIILNNKLVTYYIRVHLIGLKNILQTSSNIQTDLIKDVFVFDNKNKLDIQGVVNYYYLHNNIKCLTNEINTQTGIKTTTVSPHHQAEIKNILNTTSDIMVWYKQNEIETLYNKINTTYTVSHYYINIIKPVLDNIQTQSYTQIPKLKHESLVDNINEIITTTNTSLSRNIVIQNVSNNIQTQSNIKFQKTLEAFTNIYLYTQAVSNSFTLHNDLEYTHKLVTQSNLNKSYKHKEISYTDVINTTQNINIMKQANITSSDSVVTYAKTTIPETVDTHVEGLVNKLNTDKNINIYYEHKILEDLTNIISTDSSVKYYNHLLLNIDNYITSVSYYNISITGVLEASLSTLNIDSGTQIYYKYVDNFTLNNVLNTTSNLTHIKELIYEPFNIANITSNCLVAEFIFKIITNINNNIDTSASCQTYYKAKNDLMVSNSLNTSYNQTYTLTAYDFEGSEDSRINTTSILNQVFNAKYTITLNKQGGSGGTNSINYINTHYINPVSVIIPTRNYYNACGYYEESFSGECFDWLAIVPTNSNTNKRVAFETSIYKGDNAMFLNSLYTNSTLWRLHAIVSSTHPITQFDISDQLITSQVIILSTSPLYMYLIDVGITDNMANYNPNGSHYEFLDCVTNGDAIITFKDTWVYKKEYALTQRISSEGVYINLTKDTYNSNKTLYAQWTPYSIKVNWKNYVGDIVKTQNVYYEGYSDITPAISYAPIGTTNTTQYTYNWPVASYSINSAHTHRQVINIQETRTVNKYTITWKNYAGTVLKQETINYGTTSTAPTGTTNTAQYTYSWPKVSTTVVGNETIQETRTVNKYNIIFKNYAGSIVSTQNLAYGATPTPPANTANTTQYTYSWPSVNTVTDTITYTEIRTVNKYTLTWKNYIGTTLLTNSYDYGTVVNAPIGTTNTAGYTYAWPKTSVTVTKNETVQETRTANKFTVNFNANGGTTPVPTTKQVTYNEAYGTLAATSKTAYSFLGWFNEASGGSKILSTTNMTTTSDHTLYAHWNPVTISFLNNSCNTTSQTDTQFGENLFVSRTEIINTTSGLEHHNQTIFTITLNKQGGSGGTNIIEGLTNVSISPTSVTTPVKTNYSFTGYFTQISGGTKYINSNGTYNNLDSTTFIGDIILYAQWTIVNRTTQWAVEPSTIGIKADVFINNSIKGSGVTSYSAAQAANMTIKVKNHIVPNGWIYNTYTLSSLTNVSTGGSGNSIEVQADGDMTKTGTRLLTTKFKGISYSVAVNQNGGSGSSASTATYTPNTTSNINIIMTKGTRTNYRVVGWSLSGANGQATVSGQIVTIPKYTTTVQPYGNLTISPIWATAIAEANNSVNTSVIISYDVVHPINITLDKQGGSGGTSSIISVKGFYTDPTSVITPTKTGHTFKGYYTSTNGVGTQRINASGIFISLTHTTYSENTTLYAYWSVNQYTISFNSVGGTAVNSITQNYGTAITPPTEPTKTGYTFAGWSAPLPATMPASNLNLTAQWVANIYILSFNGNGGSSPPSKSITYNNTYGELTDSTRTDYQFLGWFNATSGSSKITPTTTVTTANNHTLYAHWNPTQIKEILNVIETIGITTTNYTPAVYNITTYKGNNVNTLSVTPTTYSPSTNSQTITINRTANTGYSLNVATITRFGDYGGNTPTVSGTIVTIPANSYGVFSVNQTASANTYTLSFDSDGGSTPSPTSKSVTYNSTIGALPSAPTKTGYTFDGWYIGVTKVLSTTTWTYTSNQTAIAKWTPKVYFVEYDPVEDVLIIKDPYKYITYNTVYGQPPAFGGLLGYTLAGWETADGFAVTPSTIMNRAYDHTLYAVWEPNAFDITLNPNTGTAGAKTKIAVVYKTSIEPFSNNMKPTKTGYTFKGFYTSASGGTQRIGPSSYINLTSSTYSSATTLYAQWQGSTHSIYFNANGGSTPSPSSKIVTYGQPVGALPNTTKSGFVFDGWYDGDIEITADTIWLTDSSRTLTAKWIVPKTTKPTLATHIECKQQGMFEMCTMYLDVQNNMSFTGTIKYGSSNPPSYNGGTIIGNGSKQISIGSLLKGKWDGADYYYATITVDGYEESDVAVVYVST